MPGEDSLQTDNLKFLAERIFQRNCVPFLGSGISVTAALFQPNEVSQAVKNLRSVTDLKKNLITECLSSCTQVCSCLQKSLGELCERFTWLNGSDSAFKELVNRLGIEHYSQFAPTLAHRALALLVREGLILQIFTTNYDPLLEYAFLASFGEAIERVPSQNKGNHKRLSIVHDRESCRQQNPGAQGSGECLHLFKINGCAVALARDESRSYAKNILLTQQQLQDWRERQWARDAFRVALRSNTLFFSGFGSDEPQVIHTIHQIMEEHSDRQSPNQQAAIEDLYKQSALLMIHLFERPLLFCHKQVLFSFFKSLGLEAQFAQQHEKLVIGPSEPQERLSADKLWRRLYVEVQRRLAKTVLKQVAEGHSAVSRIPGARRSLSAYVEALPGIELLATSPFDDADRFWPLTRLDLLLSWILHNGREFVPLSRHRELVARLLCLLHAFNCHSMRFEHETKAPETHEAPVPRWRVELQEPQTLVFTSAQDPAFCITGCPHLPSRAHFKQVPHASLAVFYLSEGHGSLDQELKTFRLLQQGSPRTCGKGYVFEWDDLIQLSSSERAKGYPEQLRALAAHPQLWLSKTRTSRVRSPKIGETHEFTLYP